jgi:hypothetical protein
MEESKVQIFLKEKTLRSSLDDNQIIFGQSITDENSDKPEQRETTINVSNFVQGKYNY